MTHSELRPPPTLPGLPRFLASRASWPPALPGLPRLLTRAVPALSLAGLAMTLLPAPAQAGHWVFTTTASGQSTLDGRLQRTLYVPSGPTTNSVSTGHALAASESYGPATGAGPPVTETATSDITISVKAVWTADGNSDDTAPPDGIYFSEDTTATGTFSSNGGPVQASTMVDDGFKDPITQSGSSIGTAAQVHYVKSSGGSATATLTASVTSTGTTGSAGGASASASIGLITISIHPQPYNYRKTGQRDNGNGTISFTYDWLSTTGNKADLTTCSWHEYVTYAGATGPSSYFPPSCFANPSGLDNPTIEPSPGTASMASTTCTDTHYTWNVSSFYVYTTVTAPQSYEFDDSATGQTNVLVPGPDSTASIVRTVTNTGAPSPSFNAWYYSVSKQGLTAWLELP